MGNIDLQQLLAKYAAGNCTPEEIDLLMGWYLKQDQQFAGELSSQDIEDDLQLIYDTLPHHRKTARIWLRVAAAVAILAASSFYLYLTNHKSAESQLAKLSPKERFKNDLLPNRYNASLILSNGQTIKLDSTHNGLIANQGNFKINKQKGCALIYQASTTKAGAPQNELAVFNKISIPRGGGKYKIVLSDGSSVWLNAASSISYPVSFSGKERRIKLLGEAYFAIVHNKRAKFVVETSRGDIEDIGTEFNVMAYPDEPSMRTTLLKGAVRVVTKKDTKIMTPGQQASVQTQDKTIRLDPNADTDGAVAWKNEEFQFNDENLKSIMRQLQRWYNVTIDADQVPDTHFYGAISRNASLVQVLSMLEKTGNIKFAVEGQTLKVLKQQ